MRTLVLPRRFAEDHFDRTAEQAGQVEILGVSRNRVVARMDDEALANLVDDVWHYLHEYGPDDCPGWVKPAARRVQLALRKQGVSV